MANANKHSFCTSDTALTAYLSTEGYEFSKDFSNPYKVVFIFDNNTKSFSEAVRAYNMGTATINASQFNHNYRKLISEIQREIKLYGKGNE